MKTYDILRDNEIIQIDEYKNIKKKYNAIVKFATENVKWYKEHFGKDTDIITKEDLRNNFDELLSDNTTKDTIDMTTTGSTGIPLTTRWTKYEYNCATMEVWKYRIANGATFNSPIIYFNGNPNVNNMIARIEEISKNSYRFDRVFTDDATREYLRFLKNKSNAILYGSSSTIYNFALAIERINERCSGISCIELNGEVVLQHEYNQIKETFNTKIINNYGAREVWPIAITCEYGHLHVNNTVYLENIENSNDILVTSLIKKRQPLIRYKIGDIGKVEWCRCKCGRTSQMVLDLVGRKNDYLYVSKNKKIHWSIISRPIIDYVVKHPNNIKEFYIHQHKDLSIILYIVPGSNYSIKDNDFLYDMLIKMLGNLSIKVIVISSIKQNRRGKRIYLQCDV